MSVVPIVLPARRKRGRTAKLMPGQYTALTKAVALGEVSRGDRVQYRTAKALSDAGLVVLKGDEAGDWCARITARGRERLAEEDRRALYGAPRRAKWEKQS